MARNTPLDPIVVEDLRGGRNDTDSPMSLPLNQATEFLNCDWKDTAFGRKRGGATSVSLTGGTAFANDMNFLFRHVPGASEAAAELWAICSTPLTKRLTGGTSWADVTFDDAISSETFNVTAATLNGKLFLAYDSSVDRLHVYDPNLASARVRRVGFATPAAPTVANTGSGTYAAVLRYYRVRWLQVATIGGASVVVRRSEPGASVSFTPSGSGTHARVTQPTVPGEGETHWELEVSSDNATWYWRKGFEADNGAGGQIAIGTTTFDDNEVAANYDDYGSDNNSTGMNGRFPSVKFIMSDGNRLLGGGAWETSGADSSGKNSRIWFTPVLGSADRGDDERVPNQATQKNWVDLNENDGGAFTGCGGPLNGLPWWFKDRQVWRLMPTGDVATPYLPRKIRGDIGCINHKTITIGEDQFGRAALYFLSHRGPYRITFEGDIQYLGRDNEATWRSMNLGATAIVAHAMYYPDLHQWWVWIATSSNAPTVVKMVFDVQLGTPDEIGRIRGGWAKHDGASASARASCLFANTLGASMSRDLKPYIATNSTTILKCDTSDTDDAGTDFKAEMTTRPLLMTRDLTHKVGLAESTLIAKALAGSDVTVTITRDFGKETRAHSVSLAPAASETRVIKKVEGSEMGEADVIQLTVGDSAANDEVWTIDAIIAPVIAQETR